MNTIIPYLHIETNTINNNFSQFGYKERIKIERCLFLLAKYLCQILINYNLQGFTKHDQEIITLKLSEINCDKQIVNVFNHIFHLKYTIQSLSSENAYVRGDALSKLNLDRTNIISFLKNQIHHITNSITTILNE
jgi:hypothetical protein